MCMRPNKSLLLSLMDPARFLLPQGARRVKCATEFGCYLPWIRSGSAWRSIVGLWLVLNSSLSFAVTDKYVTNREDLERAGFAIAVRESSYDGLISFWVTIPAQYDWSSEALNVPFSGVSLVEPLDPIRMDGDYPELMVDVPVERLPLATYEYEGSYVTSVVTIGVSKLQGRYFVFSFSRGRGYAPVLVNVPACTFFENCE